MAEIQMTEGQLGARLRSDADGLPAVVIRATFSAAQRGKALLVKNSPVDRGILRNAWKVIKLSGDQGVELVNDQPYAGIMERGARPFKMSSEGVFYLKGWVMRKLQSGQMFANGTNTKVVWSRGWDKASRKAQGQSLIRSHRLVKPKGTALEDEAERIAWAIAKNFEKVGIKGRRFVMKNLLVLAALMDQEVTRYLTKFFNRPVRGST
jgi:hypothetical protein